MQYLIGSWEGWVGSGSHLRIGRDIHFAFNSIEEAIETICMDSMTQKERME